MSIYLTCALPAYGVCIPQIGLTPAEPASGSLFDQRAKSSDSLQIRIKPLSTKNHKNRYQLIQLALVLDIDFSVVISVVLRVLLRGSTSTVSAIINIVARNPACRCFLMFLP